MMSSYDPLEHRGFIEAVKNGQTAEVERYLDAHPHFLDLHIVHKRTALHFAAVNGHDSTAALLLRRGSQSLDSPDNNGYAPLHWAARYGRDSMVEFLLKSCSISLDSPNDEGQTPLFLAAWNGHDSTVEVLLRNGSTSVDFPNNDGHSPLYTAAARSHDSTVRILKAAIGTSATIPIIHWFDFEIFETLQEAIPEEEILEIRFRIYFGESLLSRLLL